MSLHERQDIIVLGASIVYIGAIIGAMYGWGAADDWDAGNPTNWPDPDRFWPKVNHI